MPPKRPKDTKKRKRIRNLSPKGKGEAVVKGGVTSVKPTSVHLSGSSENPTESVSF
jgi:hypothetical protein